MLYQTSEHSRESGETHCGKYEIKAKQDEQYHKNLPDLVVKGFQVH
jgi:hypothetical protein